MTNKVVRFKGNSNKVPKETGNFYIDHNKAYFVDESKNLFTFANADAQNMLQCCSVIFGARVQMLQQQIAQLKNQDTITVNATENVNNAEKDLIVSIDQPITNQVDVVGKSITVKSMNIENTLATYTAEGDVRISNLNTDGELAKSVSNAQVKINSNEYIMINDSTIGQDGYNGIEIGLNSVPKSVLIDGINFSSTLSNNAISIFATQDNATVTISNCTFSNCSNPLRLSNRTNSHLTVNLVNCNFEKWEEGQYAVAVLLQDYTSTKEDPNRLAILKVGAIDVENWSGEANVKPTEDYFSDLFSNEYQDQPQWQLITQHPVSNYEYAKIHEDSLLFKKALPNGKNIYFGSILAYENKYVIAFFTDDYFTDDYFANYDFEEQGIWKMVHDDHHVIGTCDQGILSYNNLNNIDNVLNYDRGYLMKIKVQIGVKQAEINDLFSSDKVTINFVNCYHNGKKIQFSEYSENWEGSSAHHYIGTKNNNQIVYVYTNQQGFVTPKWETLSDGYSYPKRTIAYRYPSITTK